MSNDVQAKSANQDQLISHGIDPRIWQDELLRPIESRLRAAGDFSGVTVDRQIDMLRELSTLELGRFLILNRGMNAYWTHQVVTYHHDAASTGMSTLERRLFEELPAVLATRERFDIFRQQVQALLRPGLSLASVPSGFMSDLLSLDYSEHSDITLLGMDLDQQALDGAAAMAQARGMAGRVSLQCADAWTATWQTQVDVLTSNGLNIYEPDDARVVSLYRSFFAALKPGGTLVTSFLTPPPALSAESPWNFAQIDGEALALQYLLFVRIIEAKWSAFRTHVTTRAQLESAGFTDIRFIDDRASMFPTVVARKSA